MTMQAWPNVTASFFMRKPVGDMGDSHMHSASNFLQCKLKGRICQFITCRLSPILQSFSIKNKAYHRNNDVCRLHYMLSQTTIRDKSDKAVYSRGSIYHYVSDN